MKALISTIEPIETGYRVAQVHEIGFEVSNQFYWVECENHIESDRYWYDPNTQTFTEIILPTFKTNGTVPF